MWPGAPIPLVAALNPNCAVFVHLFFPNRNRLFESVNGKAAGSKGWSAVCRTDDYGNAALAGKQATQPVNNADFPNLILLLGEFSDLRQHLQSHGFIRMVFEMLDPLSA